MANETQKRRHSGRRRSRLTRGQKALAAVAAVLAVALVAAAAWKSMFVRPDVELPTGEGSEPGTPDWGDGIQPAAGGERKSDAWYTFLILGRDTGGGGNTDTMLLASYDVTNQKATVMSIPRDTMVNVPWDVKKINSVYNSAGGGEEGIQALYREVAQLVGFQPDFQVVIEWEAVSAIVDAIGGVWFDVPYFMEYDDPLQNLHIYQPDGYRLLTGEDAMQVIRWRENNNSSTHGYRREDGGIGDSGRMKIQQDFLKAVIRQMFQPENILNVREILSVFRENVETDLTLRNLAWLAGQAVTGGFSAESVEFCTMPWTSGNVYSRYYSNLYGRYSTLNYVFPIADELLELVNTKLSPYQEVFALSDLDIMSVNADGSVSSSTGHVEDTKAARPPAKLSSSPSTPTEAPAEETPPEESGPPAEQEPAGEAGAADPPEAAPEEGESSPETTPPAGGTAESSPPPSAGEMPDGGGTAAEAPDDGFIIMS